MVFSKQQTYLLGGLVFSLLATLQQANRGVRPTYGDRAMCHACFQPAQGTSCHDNFACAPLFWRAHLLYSCCPALDPDLRLCHAVLLTALRCAAWTCACSEDLQEMMVSSAARACMI